MVLPDVERILFGDEAVYVNVSGLKQVDWYSSQAVERFTSSVSK